MHSVYSLFNGKHNVVNLNNVYQFQCILKTFFENREHMMRDIQKAVVNTISNFVGKCLNGKARSYAHKQFLKTPFLLSFIIRNSILLGEIFEMEILMDLHVMRVPESENNIFSV